MGDALTDPDSKTDSTTRSLEEILAAIVKLGAGVLAAHRCALAWTDAGGIAHVTRAPESGARWDGALSAAIAALDHKLIDSHGASSSALRMIELSKREIASLARARREGDADGTLSAAAFIEGAAALRIAVAAPADRVREKVEALLELVARAALAEITSAGASDALEYWREQSARSFRSSRQADLPKPEASEMSNLRARVAVLEAEAERRRALVSRLSLRMFAAIDEERARIARDLHDDQAQLLSAAQIALEGGRAEARTIFKQVEQELRSKIRELKPATLGSLTLADAIEREFSRLRDAGVTPTLTRGADADGISRPVQQLCLQVTREAISNVVRHARAKSVEVKIERSDTAARVTIADNGRGVNSKAGGGAGLAGVRERLELMGGSLVVKSSARGTTVAAEIPELEPPERT